MKQHFYFAVLLLAIPVLFTSCSKSPREHVQAALDLEMKGDIPGAIAELSESIKVRSDNTTEKEADNADELVKDLVHRADLYLKSGEDEKAYADACNAYWFASSDAKSVQDPRAVKNMVVKCETALQEKQPDYFQTHKKKSAEF